MEIYDALVCLHSELIRFTRGKPPPMQWTLSSAIQILQASPVSRPVLLAQLELLWKSHTSRQTVSKFSPNSLQTCHVLLGVVRNVDNFSFEFIDDETKIRLDMIPHRQFSDFQAYLMHMGCQLYNSSRRFILTRCRTILTSRTPVLLSSELACPLLNYNTDDDLILISNCLAPLHDSICDEPSYYEDAMQGLFAEVTFISDIYEYPTSFNKQYRIIKLQYRRMITEESDSKRRKLNENIIRTVLLFLYDDQVVMSSLWRVGQGIFLYRPYIMNNSQEILFGNSIDHSRASFHYIEVSRPGATVESLVSGSDNLQPFHFLYGVITVICLVENMPFIHYLHDITTIPTDSNSLFRQDILAKYSLHPKDDLIIDTSKASSLIHPYDILPGMINISFLAQVLDTSQDTISVIPLVRDKNTKCFLCFTGVFIIKYSADVTIGNVIFLRGITILSIINESNNLSSTLNCYICNMCSLLNRRNCCPSYRKVICSIESSSTQYEQYQFCNLSRLSTIALSPSIFPSHILGELQHRDKSYSSVIVVNAYISLRDAPTTSDDLAGISRKDVWLHDGTAPVLARISDNVIIVSTKLQDSDAIHAKLEFLKLCQFTCLLTCMPDSTMIVEAIVDLVVSGQTYAALRNQLRS